MPGCIWSQFFSFPRECQDVLVWMPAQSRLSSRMSRLKCPDNGSGIWLNVVWRLPTTGAKRIPFLKLQQSKTLGEKKNECQLKVLSRNCVLFVGQIRGTALLCICKNTAISREDRLTRTCRITTVIVNEFCHLPTLLFCTVTGDGYTGKLQKQSISANCQKHVSCSPQIDWIAKNLCTSICDDRLIFFRSYCSFLPMLCDRCQYIASVLVLKFSVDCCQSSCDFLSHV